MKRITLVFLIIAGLLLTSCVPYIDPLESHQQGSVVRGSINLRNMDIPLPEGEWEVIGRGYANSNNHVEIILMNMKTEDGIYIQRDTMSNSFSGYLSSKYLKRKDVHHVVVENNYRGEAQDGWLVNHYRLSLPKSAPATEEARNYLLKNKISLPGNFIQIHHRFTGINVKKKYLVFNYYVNPETRGFAPPLNSEWASSDWHPLKISSDPKKVEFVEKMKEEGAIMHKKIKEAFIRKPTTSSEKNNSNIAPKAVSPSQKTTSTDTETKLMKLKEMHEKGLIKEDEYDIKRKQILDQM